MNRYYLGIDLGGTGSRLGIWQHRQCIAQLHSPGVHIGERGTNIAALAGDLIARATEWIAANGAQSATIAGVGLGATGISSLVPDQPALAHQLAKQSTCDEVALAADVVTAHLGALSGSDGAVVAVGTGAIALGTDFHHVWQRVDGYGHLLGDRGGGAWIGMEGLRAAVTFFDGVQPESVHLYDAAVTRFGELAGWPQMLYTAQNRAGIMAQFATDVIALAESDPRAAMITRQAASHIAASLKAALTPELTPRISAVGGIMNSPLRAQVRNLLADSDPHITWIEPQGSPLDGAGILAQLVSRESAQATSHALGTVAPYLYVRGS